MQALGWCRESAEIITVERYDSRLVGAREMNRMCTTMSNSTALHRQIEQELHHGPMLKKERKPLWDGIVSPAHKYYVPQ